MKAEDIKKGRYVAWMCYLGILILVPTLLQPQNEFTRFHVKQGIILIIFSLASYLLSIALCTLYIGCILSSAVAIGILSLQMLGIINAISGTAEPLPFIGKYANFLKF